MSSITLAVREEGITQSDYYGILFHLDYSASHKFKATIQISTLTTLVEAFHPQQNTQAQCQYAFLPPWEVAKDNAHLANDSYLHR